MPLKIKINSKKLGFGRKKIVERRLDGPTCLVQ
jgi:hypothetical protein